MTTIDELFLKYGTDKSSKGHNYSPHYDLMLAPYKDLPINLLEIGAWEGASAKAFKEYFPKGTIFSADILYKPQYNEDRIFMVEADQSNPEDLNRLAQMQYDIICDDGSHEGAHQLLSFKHLFPALKPGGLYIIEDILCSYDGRWNNPTNIMDAIRGMVGEVQMNGKVPGSHLCANKPEQVRLYGGQSYWEDHIEFVMVAMGICFIKKM